MSNLRDGIASRDQWSYINWFPLVVNRMGMPKSELFEGDGVHLNEAGYADLAELLRQELSEPAQ